MAYEIIMSMNPFVGRLGDYIQVYSGEPMWPLDPRPEEIDITDIAHALSLQCRYSGHTKFHFSVAQHSYYVSLACDPADALWSILHDAPEAYVIDMPRPLKRLPVFAPYLEAESLIMAAICDKYGLPREMPASVKRADDALLAAEVLTLMTPRSDIWGKWLDEVTPWDGEIQRMNPEDAEELFLARFEMLTR